MDSKKISRPVPVIEDEITFSRKKKSKVFCKGNHAPRSPFKTAPPVSRVFRHRSSVTTGARAVSFRHSEMRAETNIQSPLYTNLNKLYFDQCFTPLSLLGIGSFGQVVKVQSREDGKLYAIKKSRERFRSDLDRKQRLEEVNKNEQIQCHPNCVRFYKAWEEHDHLYIQTELCEMSLKEYGESVQTIEEQEIWKMIVDLCSGLKHLHDVELAHMDIKPANLFLGRDGLYKIGDFGLVVELTRDLGDAMDGDSKYMAPELMEGNFSKAADIFSLGITILELACSLELPRGGCLWQQLRNKKLPLEFTQGLSDDLILLVSNMMDPDPANRPTVTDIMNMPCLVPAMKKRRKASSISYTPNAFIYLFWQFLLVLFSSLSKFIKGKFRVPNRFAASKSKERTSPIISLCSNSLSQYKSLPVVGHESLCVNDNIGGRHSPAPHSSCNEYSPQVSPLFDRGSPLFLPVSNKKEGDIWKVPSSDNPQGTPRNFSSNWKQVECSPSSSPMADHVVRSQMFTCSDDDSLSPQLKSLGISTNLMKAFDEKEN